MIPLTKYGWREMLIATVLWLGLSAGTCVLAGHTHPALHWLSALWLVLWVYVLSFFRDPPRRIPGGAGLLVSPADGTVTDVTDLATCEYLDGPAVRVGIFLSVFNVHLNRSPAEGVVDYLNHRPGRKVNAMRPDAGEVNERTTVGLKGTEAGKLVVRQIAGLIARRIVCPLKVGERLARGQVFGMIKFGSRTELIVPKQVGLLIAVKPGDKVKAGRDVLARITEVVASPGAGKGE